MIILVILDLLALSIAEGIRDLAPALNLFQGLDEGNGHGRTTASHEEETTKDTKGTKDFFMGVLRVSLGVPSASGGYAVTSRALRGFLF